MSDAAILAKMSQVHFGRKPDEPPASEIIPGTRYVSKTYTLVIGYECLWRRHCFSQERGFRLEMTTIKGNGIDSIQKHPLMLGKSKQSGEERCHVHGYGLHRLCTAVVAVASAIFVIAVAAVT